MKDPKLRDSNRHMESEAYPLNEFPDWMLEEICAYLSYFDYTDHGDVTGKDWGNIFAGSIGGTHLDSPLGIADIVLGHQAWSLKTVKNKNPFACSSVRLISGRCAPGYSYGIHDVRKDIQKTGRAVLGIWNARLKLAREEYSQVRTTVLVRGEDRLSFLLFEKETVQFSPSDFTWYQNVRGNLIGVDQDGNPKFTWQPHGAQFTIHERVPKSAVKFRLHHKPSRLSFQNWRKESGFDQTWFEVLSNAEEVRPCPEAGLCLQP